MTDEQKVYYQARFAAKISEILPQTIDPAKGKILERKFVPLSELNKILNWGTIGDELVKLTQAYL